MNSNLRRIGLAIALPAALVVTTSDCGPSQEADAELSRHIADEVQSGPGTVIDIAGLTEFEWDELYVFGPYTEVESINRSLGFRWRDADNTDIDTDEGITLLVFVRGDKVVRYVEHPRNRGNFSTVARQEPWLPEDSFVLREVDQGEPWIEIAPLPPDLAPSQARPADAPQCWARLDPIGAPLTRWTLGGHPVR